MRRLMLLLGAAPVGIATGIVAWLAAGGASANVAPLEAIQAKLAGLRAPAAHAPRIGASAEELVAMPLFPMTTGPNAVVDPTVRLEGVSRSPRRVAALLSIDGKPSDWLALGETRDGVVLRQVSAAGIVVDTPTGPKDVALGDASGPPPTASADPPPGNLGPANGPPPGFRSPPPPASAPLARR